MDPETAKSFKTWFNSYEKGEGETRATKVRRHANVGLPVDTWLKMAYNEGWKAALRTYEKSKEETKR